MRTYSLLVIFVTPQPRDEEVSMNTLSTELIVKIAKFMGVKTLGRFCQTSKGILSVVTSASKEIWAHMLRRDMPRKAAWLRKDFDIVYESQVMYKVCIVYCRTLLT